jgi:Zn ribbon nucleic-acid-binding protein
MAAAVCGNISCSDTLMNITSDSTINTCMNCGNNEKLLKEALNELSSAQTIIKLLQNELLVAKRASREMTPTTMKVTVLQLNLGSGQK